MPETIAGNIYDIDIDTNVFEWIDHEKISKCPGTFSIKEWLYNRELLYITKTRKQFYFCGAPGISHDWFAKPSITLCSNEEAFNWLKKRNAPVDTIKEYFKEFDND